MRIKALPIALLCLIPWLLPVALSAQPSGGNNKKAQPSAPPIPDDLILVGPDIEYPDRQYMTGLSGHVTVIFKAGGSYTFRADYNYKKDNVINVNLDLTMTVEYHRVGNGELITTSVNGTKTTTENAPSKGSKRPGFPYHPSRHVIEVETYTGSSSRRENGYAIHSIIWSKEAKLACFKANLGDQQSPFLTSIPIKIHTDHDIAYDNEHTRSSNDGANILQAIIPSHSSAHTRFARLVGDNGGPNEAYGGWIETASTQGTTNGSFTIPMFFDGVDWHTEAVYKNGGRDPRKAPVHESDILWPGSVQVVWAFANKMPEGKMTIAPEDGKEYAQWIPSPIDDEVHFGPAQTVSFTARIKPKEEGKPAPQGKIDFWLTDLSHEKGKCANFPRVDDGKDDLRFTQDQAGLIIDPQNPRHAYTEKYGDSATIKVEATDAGAYGSLQATCDDLGLVAEDERTHRQSISIPLDDNHNHVADAWEDEKGIKGENLPADWDQEKVEGQDATGDSLTLYENYRGLMVLMDGKPVFKRPEPKRKALFVVDDGDMFDTALWLHASGITAYKLNESLVKGGAPDDASSRIVDFNGGDGGHKYCVRLIKQAGLVENTPYKDQPPDRITIYGYTDNQGNSPKTTLRCVVFPARLRAMIDRVASYVDHGVKDPSSEDARALEEAGLPPWLAQKALARLDQATRDLLAKQMVTLCAIHEMGHACGLPGHLDGEGKESESGDPKCPMKYTDRAENRRLMILQVIFALDHPLPLQYDRFCRDGYDCFGALNVKD